MAFPDTILRSIKEAIKSSGRLPESTSYAVFELDQDGGQANVRPPIVEITTVDRLRSSSMNTDFVGHSEDSSGNHIGRIYRALFQMPVQINVITAEGDGHDPKEIGKDIRFALYRYEDRQEGDPLPDPDSTGDIGDVNRFQLAEGGPNDDLGLTPALRGSQEQANVWFEEVIDTAEEYGKKDFVETVDVPTADGFVGGSGSVEIVFDASPSQTSTADSYT